MKIFFFAVEDVCSMFYFHEKSDDGDLKGVKVC